jgi:glycosyltransferase involved in cell wall biosynthesis
MDKKEIAVSVIIPIYHVSAYIERCIRSVMNQTFSDFECILVDDCGTDDSIAKCEKMIAEHDGLIRFKMIHHE